MFGIQPKRRGTPRPARARAARPALESLEARKLLYSTTGGSWIYPVRITYSIVPDGTSIGGTPSNLQETFASKPGWQLQIQKAAAAWAAATGINLVEVPDNGAPIGSGDYQQGDPASGDIRIGGMPQSGSQLAFAFSPQSFNGGPLAGDILFNTDQSWQIDGNTYDLRTVAVHEFGHALGMGHSGTYSATQYASYLYAKQSLTSDDTAGIRSIYGSRNPDAFDAAASNNSHTRSSDITPYIDGVGRVALAALDVSTMSDVDWYKLTVPNSTTGTMAVTMQPSNLSSLIPRVTVYDGSLQPVADSGGTSHGSTVSVTVGGVAPGQTWYIKAMAGDSGPAGIGAYGLLVNLGPDYQGAIEPPNTVVTAQPDNNPTATPMGQGWIIGGQFIPYLGVLGVTVGSLVDVSNGLHRIVHGNLSGFGDVLKASDPAGQEHRHGGDLSAGGMHPKGPRWRRGGLLSDAPSEATIIPLSPDPGADDTEVGSGVMARRRGGILVRDPAARFRAVVEVAPSGWTPTARSERLRFLSAIASRRGTPPRIHRTIAYYRPQPFVMRSHESILPTRSPRQLPATT